MTILFVGEWLLRSSLLILCGAALVRLLPVKGPAARMAAWTALLGSSLAIPPLHAILPQVALAVFPAPAYRAPASTAARVVYEAPPIPAPIAVAHPVIYTPAVLPRTAEAKRIDWPRLAAVFYFLTTSALLFRLLMGLLLSLRLYHRSRPAGISAGATEVRECDGIASPATVGVLRPVILLPSGWRHWHTAKLAAVLAHEGSHIRRRDPAIQFVSAIHRALLWASPASWLLDRAIVRCAEQISDDDAIAATHDRVSYAETLLEFFQSSAGPRHALVVPMARYDRPEKRIRRILRSTGIPSRFSRARIAATLLAAAPMAYLAAAAHPQSAGSMPAFDIADVHVSPRGEWVQSQSKPLQGGYLAGDRYELRRATMLDLIRLAYNEDPWLDLRRAELARLRPFRYRRQDESRNTAGNPPAYAANAAPAALPSGGKKGHARRTGLCALPGQRRVENESGFREPFRRLHIHETGHLWRHLESRVPRRVHGAVCGRASPASDSRPPQIAGGRCHRPQRRLEFRSRNSHRVWSIVAQAVEKLGIRCESSSVPQPVLVVESVSEQPTANSPEVTARLAPPPAPSFEVASLKPCTGGAGQPPWFEAGGRVTANCMPLASLITWAWHLEQWELTPSNLPIGLPDKIANQYISIVAKAPAGFAPNPNPQHNAEARDVLYAMLRTLLIERYRMKMHYEDRPVDAATLVAVKPKLAKADPSGRTGCAHANVPQSERGLTGYVCRNITMAQFAEQLQGLDPTLSQVEDRTGLRGAWDFTLNFNMLATLNRRFPRPVGRAVDGEASEPSGALLLSQAIEKQLGLKLETRKRPASVLVIDHIEQNPIGN